MHHQSLGQPSLFQDNLIFCFQAFHNSNIWYLSAYSHSNHYWNFYSFDSWFHQFFDSPDTLASSSNNIHFIFEQELNIWCYFLVITRPVKSWLLSIKHRLAIHPAQWSKTIKHSYIKNMATMPLVSILVSSSIIQVNKWKMKYVKKNMRFLLSLLIYFNK